MKFFYFLLIFLKKKEGKVSWQACGCKPTELKSGAFVVVLRQPSLSLSLLRFETAVVTLIIKLCRVSESFVVVEN